MRIGRELGLVIGIVSNRNDDEGLGRVKLKLPVYDDIETDWARVAVPYGGAAGEGHGFHWVPEKGDEVLVAFLHGDPKLPVVVGTVYSKKQKPPSKKVDERVIRSRKGHTITVSDEDGSERIEIKTKSGQAVTIDETSMTVTVKATAKVVVDAAQIELGGSGASHPFVLGDIFMSHTHAGGTIMTPAGPATGPVNPPHNVLALSTIVKAKG